MRRFLAIVIFATAAAGATAAGAGVIVAPHIDPPGTPFFHTNHVFAAYRLPLFLGTLRARYDAKQGLVSTQSAFDLAAIALALLALLWPRLPRPTLRAIAEVARLRIARALWRSPLILGPPRPLLP
jgi:hypothetical protein